MSATPRREFVADWLDRNFFWIFFLALMTVFAYLLCMLWGIV